MVTVIRSVLKDASASLDQMLLRRCLQGHWALKFYAFLVNCRKCEACSCRNGAGAGQPGLIWPVRYLQQMWWFGEGESILVAANAAKKDFEDKAPSCFWKQYSQPPYMPLALPFSCKEWLKPVMTAAIFYWGRKKKRTKNPPENSPFVFQRMAWSWIFEWLNWTRYISLSSSLAMQLFGFSIPVSLRSNGFLNTAQIVESGTKPGCTAGVSALEIWDVHEPCFRMHA